MQNQFGMSSNGGGGERANEQLGRPTHITAMQLPNRCRLCECVYHFASPPQQTPTCVGVGAISETSPRDDVLRNRSTCAHCMMSRRAKSHTVPFSAPGENAGCLYFIFQADGIMFKY